MKLTEKFEVNSNISLIFRERGKIVCRRETKNIVTNIGRLYMARVITASAFPTPSTFTRTNDNVIRYIGFGIGGNRQTSPLASTPPMSTDYPGTNTQTDTDLTVTGLERPVRVTAAPLWMQQIAAPGTFFDPPSPVATRFIALFSETEISYGGYSSVPLSEIGLFLSSADSTLANGGVGGGHIAAYDVFDSIHKTGQWSVEVRWEWRM